MNVIISRARKPTLFDLWNVGIILALLVKRFGTVDERNPAPLGMYKTL